MSDDIFRDAMFGLRDDKSLHLAFASAAHAMGMLVDTPAAGAYNLGWPTLGTAGLDDGLAAVRNVMAPFVRANRDAPAEALYIHARGQGVHRERRAWSVLPLTDTFPYALFIQVLNQTDAALALQAAELDAATRPTPAPRKPGRDDHTMEQHDSAFDRVDLGRGPVTDPRLRKSTLSIKRKG